MNRTTAHASLLPPLRLEELVAALLAALGTLAWTQPLVSGADTWWMLAAGREIWTSGAIPGVDSFSHTSAGQVWMNHEWIWTLAAWALYRINPQLVAWANLAVVFSLALLIYLSARRIAGSPGAATLATWAAAATMHWFVDVRPHLITLVLVAFVLWTCRERWAPWAWPALLLFWVNVHGGFTFGIGLIGLVALVLCVERSLEAGRPQLALAPTIGVALAIVATLANPWGYHIVEYPLAYLDGSSVFRQITEWGATPFGLDPAGFEGRFWWLVVLAAAGIPAALRREPTLVPLCLVSAAMALTSRRFIPLFAVTAAPLVALSLALVVDRVAGALQRRVPRLALGSWSVGALVVIVWWQGVTLTPSLLERWTLSPLLPRAAVAALREIAPARPFHDLNWGGYIILAAPEIPVFIDGRANTVYDEALITEYLTVNQLRPGLAQVLERRAIDAVLTESHHALVPTLRQADPPWTVAYRDATAVILLAPGSAARRLADPASASTCAGRRLQAFRLARRGDGASAIALLERAVADEALCYPAWGDLATNHARAGREDAAFLALEQGRRAYPRAGRELGIVRGRVLELLGRPDEAQVAYRRARPRGPFGADLLLEQQIGTLEQAP